MSEQRNTSTDTATGPPAPTVWHSLSYVDALAAIEFLTSAFGFVSKAVYTHDDPTRVVHAELHWPPGGGIMLGSSGRPEGMVDPTGHASAYCVLDGDDSDVDVLFERATAAGAVVVREPRDEGYGGRGCSLRDPEGNQWSFGTYRGE
jgi:uncharacterized glyoxalase superfamily protein PhnB